MDHNVNLYSHSLIHFSNNYITVSVSLVGEKMERSFMFKDSVKIFEIIKN